MQLNENKYVKDSQGPRHPEQATDHRPDHGTPQRWGQAATALAEICRQVTQFYWTAPIIVI
jgi:hypothetical protein